MKTHILCSVTFFRKTRRKATNDVTIWHMRVACWISKSTCTHAHSHAHALGHTHAHTHNYVIFIAFSRDQWFANAPQCYVIRTLSVLLVFRISRFLSLSKYTTIFLKFCFFYFHYYTYWTFLFTAGGSSRWVLSQKVIRHGFCEARMRRGIKIRAQEWRWRFGSINAAGCTSRRGYIFW